MTVIPENKISEIKNTADIVDAVSEVVLLKKTGRYYTGLCPFHSEKTPSFTVSPEKKIFHCFGCGAGGDVFEFVQKHEGVTFPEAAQLLAKKYGIEIPAHSMSPEQKQRLTERESLFAVNKQAMNFFSYQLLNTGSGQKALNYLTKRGLRKEIHSDFFLGYAPAGWDNLVNFLNKKKIPLGLAAKAGLVVDRSRDAHEGNNKRGYYDRFRDRIIFPIFDTSMQVIGFGGRVMDSSLPKYLNSPETLLYKKSRSLYGLHLAKSECRESQKVFIVEGYMDLLALYQHGIKNSVATLGTALTQEHVKILKGHIGHSGKIILVFDSDEAGKNAAKRSVEVFDREEIDAYVMELPEGHDPDSYLLKYGPEPFMKIADTALPTLLFLIDVSIKRYGQSIDGKLNVVSDMMEPLSTIRDNVKRSLYVKELAERTGIDEAVIFEKVGVALSHGNNSIGTKRFEYSSPTAKENPERTREKNHDPFSRMEKEIITMMLQYPKILPEIRKNNVIELFKDDRLRSIGQAILKHSSESDENISALSVSELMSMFDNSVDNSGIKQVIASLSIGDEDIRDLKRCLILIEKFVVSGTRCEKTLIDKIREAEEKDDHNLLMELLMELSKEKQTQAEKMKKTSLAAT